MTVTTLVLVYIKHNIAPWVAGGVTGCIPDKISWVVTGMAGCTVSMTIKTAHRGPGKDNIIYRGIPRANIARAGGIMALGAAKLMQGQDAFSATPGIGKQGVTRSGATTTVTGITGSGTRNIAPPHQHIMGRTIMDQVVGKVSHMALGADMRFGANCRLTGRTNQGSSAHTPLVTGPAIAAMDSGNDLTLGRSRTEAARAMTALTIANPGKGTVALTVGASRYCGVLDAIAGDIDAVRVAGSDV
jgi:hypothetical protein